MSTNRWCRRTSSTNGAQSSGMEVPVWCAGHRRGRALGQVLDWHYKAPPGGREAVTCLDACGKMSVLEEMGDLSCVGGLRRRRSLSHPPLVHFPIHHGATPCCL